MAAHATWAIESPATNHSESFAIEDTTPSNRELRGSGLPRIVGNSDALRRVLDMVRIVARPTPPF